ncbi:hypothetical protein [Endozoicomonas sp. SCSIO W0465]|uniref:hypothetical protein n=1 Tax=Endozoicomonas sp. SCSIO W0465 TaxID=2918516 RepID=UPI002075226F|nr:hypothetical protein [Endozoicomonas sp. SCSIO W0465]USE38888.1 hypothetical protein MJO57_12385 [Endozoicomonas sp. SCSIO W0465]
MKAMSFIPNFLVNPRTINPRMIATGFATGLSRCTKHSGNNDSAGNPENKLQQIAGQQQKLLKSQQSLAHSVMAFNGRYIALPSEVQENLMQRWREDCPYGWTMDARTHLLIGSKVTRVVFRTEDKRCEENLWNDLHSRIYSTVIDNQGFTGHLYKHSVIPSEYYPKLSKIPAREPVVELEISSIMPEARNKMITELSSIIGNPVYRLPQVLVDSKAGPQHCQEMVRELLEKVTNDGLPCAIVAIDVDQLDDIYPDSDLLSEIKQQFTRCGQKAILLLMNSDEVDMSTYSPDTHRYHVEPPAEIRQLVENQKVVTDLLVKYNELCKEIPAKSQSGLKNRLLSGLPDGWRMATTVRANKFQITELIFEPDTRKSDNLWKTIKDCASANKMPTDIDWLTTKQILDKEISWGLSGQKESDKCNEVVKNYFEKLKQYCADQGLDEVTQDAVNECAFSLELQLYSERR